MSKGMSVCEEGRVGRERGRDERRSEIYLFWEVCKLVGILTGGCMAEKEKLKTVPDREERV